jgi:predicted nucleic acid-binding protein
MSDRTAFWDSSGIVLLCCDQRSTASARTLSRDRGRMTAWWGSVVEVRSALSRLRREGDLDEDGHALALARLGVLRTAWREVVPSDALRELAEASVETHDIRSADALQLASALVWCRERPRSRAFVCFDRRLRAAATRLGFLVLPA